MPRRDLLVPSLIGGFHFVSLTWSRPIFALLAGQLGASEMMLGALTSVFYLLPLIIALPAGMLTDRWGARKLAAAGSASLVLGNVLYAVASSFVTLAAARVLCGLAQIVVLVAVQAQVANLGPAGQQDRNFGTLFFFAGVGQLAGPLLAGFTSTAHGIRLSFAVSAVLALIPLAMTLWLPDASGLVAPGGKAAGPTTAGRSSVRGRDPTRITLATIGQLLRIPGVRLGVGASLILLLADGARESLFPWYASRSLGFDEAAIGVLLSISALFSIFVQPFAGVLARALGRTRVLSLAMFLGAAGMLAVPLARSFWPMAAAMALAGLCMGANQPPTMACVADSSPPDLRGLAMSLRLAGNRVGLLLSPIWAGWLAAERGIPAYFYAAAVMLAAGSAFVGTLSGESLRVPTGEPIGPNPQAPTQTQA